jgi:hypothetical protein
MTWIETMRNAMAKITEAAGHLTLPETVGRGELT